MNDRPKPALECPTCGKVAPQDGADRPFCCERCRMVDLGAWLLGHYRIPAEEGDDADVPTLPEDKDETEGTG